MKFLSALLLIFIMILPLKATVKDGSLHISDPHRTYSILGEWHFRYGDDIKWASPDYDSSGWDRRKFPDWIKPREGTKIVEWFWYRLCFTVDPSVLRENPLGIAIPSSFQAYEVYLNGNKLGGRGRLPGKDGRWQWGFGGWHGIIPDMNILTNRKNVLAIRVFKGHNIFDSPLYNYGIIGPYNIKSNFYTFSTLVYLILATISLIFGVLNIVGYLRYRLMLRLWFALFAFSVGIYLFLFWFMETVNDPDTHMLHTFTVFFMLASQVWLIIFLKSFFYERLKNYIPAGKIIIALLAALGIIILLTGDFILLRITFYGIILANFILAPFLFLFVLSDIKRGNRESVFILAGIAAGFICLNSDILAGFNIKLLPIPESIWCLTPLGIVLLLVSISFSIDKRFGILKNKNILNKEERKRRKEIHIEKMDTAVLHDNLISLMEKEKLYFDDTLTLAGLASRLSVQPHILTEFLNKKLEVNFNSFINEYRVKEAQKLLIEQKDCTVISIAYRVGFNTISKFYDAFKKITGETPKEYRKNHDKE